MEAVAIKLFCPELNDQVNHKALHIYHNTKWALIQTYLGAHFVKLHTCIIKKQTFLNFLEYA